MLFDSYPYLKSDLVILKRMEMKDVPALTRMKSEKEIYRYEPAFLAELHCSAENFISHVSERLFNEHKNLFLGIYLASDPETLIGIAEFYNYHPQKKTVFIGIRLIQEVWHHGIGTEVNRLLKEYLLNDCEIKRIGANVCVDNTPSANALMDNGFVLCNGPYQQNWNWPHLVLVNEFEVKAS